MTESYQRVLESAERHLLALRASGVRFLNIQAETLEGLRQAPVDRPVVREPAAKIPESAAPPPIHPAPRPQIFPSTAAPIPTPQASDAPEVAQEKVEASVVTAIPGALSKEEAMKQLRSRALVCLKCPHLVKSRKNVVFGVGDIHSPLMFVGEAPGADEDRLGEPFVGAAGQLLTRIIQTMGFTRETVYIANILKCRPDTPGQSYGNRKPTSDEMRTCLPYLLAQIDLIAPKVIVALGVTAIEGLFGACDGIHKQRGNFRVFRDIPLMPTYHPAYLLRSPGLAEKRKVWEDMLQVLERLGTPISEKQRAYFLKA